MSVVYTSGKEKLLSTFNLLSGTVNAYLLSDGYTVNASHTTVSDLSGGDMRGPQALTGKSVSGGSFTASGTVWAGEEAPGEVSAIAIAVGNDLLCYIDDFGDGAGQTTISYNGSDVIASWPSSGVLAIP